MQTLNQRIHTAIKHLQQGKMIILMDNPSRENEGDLICAAETMTTEQMSFMINHTSGIVCIPMLPTALEKLNLPLMVSPHANTSARGTPFTVSVDARHGISTGVSAADRIQTIKVLINEQTKPDDLVQPGHMFPLQAKEGGVLERQGHTEGAIDIVKLAGFKPHAVLCEIMNPDGTMTRGQQLEEFSKQHNLFILSIDDIIAYRLQTENLIIDEATAIIPLADYGEFKITVLKEKLSQQEHVVLYKEPVNKSDSLLVRIHSACFTGDLFASKRCDCNNQLHHALERINEEGGMLIYLNQEGRGIGLFNKIKAYALQEQGFDTVEANTQLGLPVDARSYYLAANILRNFNIHSVRLLTNNPDKINDLIKCGITKVQREPMPTFLQQNNQFYLETKKVKLNHVINLNDKN